MIRLFGLDFVAGFYWGKPYIQGFCYRPFNLGIYKYIDFGIGFWHFAIYKERMIK